MMNRYALLLTAALGMAAAQTAPAPSPRATAAQNAISDPQLSGAKVTFEVRRTGSDLASMLIALATSAGYEIIIEPSVDSVLQANSLPAAGTAPAGNVVSYSFRNKPFNEVWPLVLDIYGLSYESLGIGGKTVLRVGVKPIQKIVKLPANLDATSTERQLKLSFGSLRKITSSQTNAAPSPAGAQASATTTEASQEEIVLDSATMRIVAEPSSNSVIIRGTNQEVAQVDRLLSQIIAAQASAPAVVKPAAIPVVQRIYSVVGSADDVVAVLGKQYPALNVSPFGTTGKVIITGPEDQLTAALGLLKQVDQTAGAGPKQVVQRVYTVNGRQEDVVAVLGKQYPALTVSPVGTTGKVVLSGPEDQLSAALTLLGQVDRAVTATPDNQTQVYAARGKSEDVAKFLAAQYPGLKVTPVGTTERLVISGPQDQLSAALGLLDKVDQAAPVAASTVQQVFTLVNASAEEVKATLEGTLARDVAQNNLVPNATLINPITGQPYTSGPLANAPLQPQASGTAANGVGAAADSAATAAQPATIIADKRTNTVIVRGTSAQVEQVAALIPQLDQKVPQINVQVRIQEITETAGRSLGIDWKVGFGGFTVSAGGGGLGAAFNPTQSLMGFNLGATLNTLQNQGLSKSVYDGAITMQSGQRSLSGSGQTQNASTSAAATIKSGGRLEINIPSAAANVPGIEKQIDYGVNLDFFNPQVAPDGSITMRVRGQVNDLKTTIDAATVPNILRFTNSEAQTTLTFKSGETLLLSGLLKTVETSNNDGVPYLSSIPVVGSLFGKQKTSKEQTQLLVVITGNIVK